MKKVNKMGQGMAMGIAFGTLVGVLTDNIGVWLCIGIAFGAGVGNTLQKRKDNDERDKD